MRVFCGDFKDTLVILVRNDYYYMIAKEPHFGITSCVIHDIEWAAEEDLEEIKDKAKIELLLKLLSDLATEFNGKVIADGFNCLKIIKSSNNLPITQFDSDCFTGESSSKYLKMSELIFNML